MSQQIQITGGAKVRNLEGVIVGSSGVVSSLGINVPSGIPQLDGSGKILVSQLPNSVMEFLGTWNAATNTPTLANGTGNAGDVYLCEVAGTVNFGAGPITFNVGDQVIYSGSIWQRASGATGTVSSVALTESGDSLNITGSPITTSGTINIGFNGNSGQYINGAGNLTTFPSLTGFVPYTGATTNVDLGTYGLLADYLKLNVLPTSIPTTESTMAWNDTDGTMDIKLKGGNVTLQVGQEQVVRIVNKSGASLLEANYQVVRIRSVAEGGAQGQRLAVVLAQGDTAVHSKGVLGLVTETIADNQEGFITILGQVHEIDTTGTLQSETWVDGDKLYLSATTAGKLTNVAPVAPNYSVVMGYVEYAHAVHGKIFVNVNEGVSLDELHDVYAPTPTANQSIWWNASTLRYENNTIAGILGYTPVPTTRTLTINGVGYDLSADRSWSIVAGVSSVTATSPLFSSGGANPNITIQQASGSQAGYLSAADWTEFNTKQEQIDGLDFVKVSGTTITYDNSSYYLSSNPSGYITSAALSGYVQGTGTTNYLPKFTGASTIGNSLIYDNGTTITLGGALSGTSATFSSSVTAGASTSSGYATFNLIDSGTGSARYASIRKNYDSPFDLRIRASNSESEAPIYFDLSNDTTAMAITSGGNVLIGTTTDAGYKLDVNGTGRFSGVLTLTQSNAGSVRPLVLDGTNTHMYLKIVTNSNYEAMTQYENPTAGAWYTGLRSSAGIGTTASYHIYSSTYGGDVFALNTSGAATFSSSVTATAFFESSDSRLKELIQDNYQTKGIGAITPKLYTKNGKVELGYYAQDFVGILDSAISKGSDDMLSLSYREVHTAKIYALEQEIKELKAKLN